MQNEKKRCNKSIVCVFLVFTCQLKNVHAYQVFFLCGLKWENVSFTTSMKRKYILYEYFSIFVDA